jgi:hypothetical protein
MPAVSLEDLQRQISERERELQALREELESRQSQFSELTRRKQELLNQLQQVEEEIAALAAATPATTEQPESAAPLAPPDDAAIAHAAGQPRLRDLIVTLLRESRVPMTARQLCQEGQRRGYEPTGRDPVKTIKARLQDLKSQGVVRRASGQPGYILAPSAHGAKKQKSEPRQPAQAGTPKAPKKPAKSESAATKRSVKGSSSSGAARKAKPGRRGGQPPLREVLTDILKNSRKPLSGSELAQRALAAGYQSGSAKFVDSVWSLLGQMANVEHVRGQGYRLKNT